MTGRAQQQITSTGWRIIGAPAVSLLSASNGLDAAPSHDPDDAVHTTSFRVRPRTGANALDPLLRAIDATIGKVRAGSGIVGRQSRFTDPASRFHSIVWRTAEQDHRWIGELAWRRAHPAIGGVAVTDHLVIEARGDDVRLTLRTFAPGGAPVLRGHVGVGQARSPLLTAVAGASRLLFGGKPVEPRVLTATDVDGFIRDVLLDDHRKFPVALLSATDDGGYHVEPTELALELIGLAHVYFFDEAKTSFNLTDGLGDKRLSCFFGALRIYQPGFSCADDMHAHPLLVHERASDPVVRAGLAGTLALANRARIEIPPTVDELTKPVPAAEPIPPSPTIVSPVVEQPVVSTVMANTGALESSIRMLADQIASFQRSNEALMDEIVRLRTTAAVRAANTANVDRRLGQLERVIREFTSPQAPATPAAIQAHGATEPVPQEEPAEVSLVDVVQQAMATHSDALLILEQALTSAEESPYVDVDRVAVILDAMAFIARRRQADAMGQSLRDTFREFGIDYRGGIARATSARQLRQYVARIAGGEVICDEHIALGSGYDPRFCLRIYFTSRAGGEPRFVIAHIGRHFDVASTT